MPLPPAVEEEVTKILSEAAETKRITSRGSIGWFWVYTLVQWAAPILTATLSVLVGAAANSHGSAATTLGIPVAPSFVLLISVLATIFTTIISTVAPERRFIRIAIVDNRLGWIMSQFRLEKAELEDKFNQQPQPPIEVAIKWAQLKRTQLTQVLDCWQSGLDLPPLN